MQVRMNTVPLFSAIQETGSGKFEKMEFHCPDFRKRSGGTALHAAGPIRGYRGFIVKLSGL